jgi:hypothetical protein
MTCQDSVLLISARLDGCASVQQQQQLATHLEACPECRLKAAELNCLRKDLGTLKGHLTSVEMTDGIIASLRQEARLQARAARQRADLLDVWRMRIFSQSIGTVVSLVLFMFLVSVILKPIYSSRIFAGVVEAADYTSSQTDYTAGNEELRKLRMALVPPGPKPVFDPSGALLGFSKSFSEDYELIVMVKVDADGRASVKKVVEPPPDPSAVTNLSNVLFQQVSFLPAARRGRFVSSDAVLMFSKVNIPG